MYVSLRQTSRSLGDCKLATIPTPESMAIEILKIFVGHFKGRIGHVLQVNNFFNIWHQRGLNWEDFLPGMQFAVDNEWIEITERKGFRLTGLGFSKAPSNHVLATIDTAASMQVSAKTVSVVFNVSGDSAAIQVGDANSQIVNSP